MDLSQNRSTQWQAPRPKVDDMLVACATLMALTYSSWIPLFRKNREIPNDFWYHVPQSTGAHTESRRKKAEERRVDHVFKERSLDWVIFWGSQSGRAEALARQLAKSLRDRFGLRALAADLDDFDAESLAKLNESQKVAFMISTYGDGEPPDNANALWSYLNKSHPQGILRSLQYAIFGLGNSNYRQFNRVAKVLDEKLGSFGARRLATLGVGDDAQGNTENDYLAWKHALQAEMRATFDLKDLKQEYRPAFSITEDLSVQKEDLHHGPPRMGHAGKTSQSRGAYTSAVTAFKVQHTHKLWEHNTRLCVHMDLDLGRDRRLKYKTGDHLAIWVCNPDQEVEQLIGCLGVSKRSHVPLRISATEGRDFGSISIPSPTTLDALFRYHLEICGQLSMETVAGLANFAPSTSARQQLLQISEDSDRFKTTVTAQNLSVGGLLRHIDSTSQWDVPLSFLLERLRSMQPRYYSIASSAAAQPTTISIVAVVNKAPNNLSDTQTGPRGCYGLATNYLWAFERSFNKERLEQSANLPSFALDGPQGILTGGKVFSHIVTSSFKLPMKSTAPIIMVGAGTGVAPFRAFVQERVQRKRLGQEVGRTMLFMGFRNHMTDFIYKDEWKSYKQALGPEVFQYWTTFSRDDPGKKEYVQHLVEEEGGYIMDMLDIPDCRFYICGSAAMARDVTSCLLRMRERFRGVSREDALQWMERLRRFSTILEDVWG